MIAASFPQVLQCSVFHINQFSPSSIITWCAFVHVWTLHRCIHFHMSKVLYPRWQSACPHLLKVMPPPRLLEITESGPSWISAHVLRYIDEGISCVHLFNFLKFLYSGACLQTCWSLLPPLQWGFIMPICQQVLDMCRMLFSRLNVIASSWIVFVAGYCPAHLSQDYLHIYWSWAIRLYLFQLQLYRMLPSVVWF